MSQPTWSLRADAKHSQSALWWKDLLLTCGQDQVIKAWDGPQVAWELRGHTATSYGLSLCGDLLLSGGSDHTLRCWDLTERHQRWCVPAVDHGSWSPTGDQIIAHKKSKQVVLMDSGGAETHVLPMPEKRIFSSAVVGDMAFLGGTTDIHVVRDRTVTGSWEGHGGSVTNIRVSPGGTRLASTGHDGSLRFWDLHGNTLGSANVPTGIGLAWNHADTAVAVTSDNAVATYSFPDASPLWSADVPVKGAYGVGWSPHDARIAVACADGIVRVWDVD